MSPSVHPTIAQSKAQSVTVVTNERRDSRHFGRGQLTFYVATFRAPANVKPTHARCRDQRHKYMAMHNLQSSIKALAVDEQRDVDRPCQTLSVPPFQCETGGARVAWGQRNL